MKKLEGVYSALVTPMNPDESINVSTLRALIDMNLARGTAGFYVSGSTGESYMLDFSERMRLLESVAEFNNGRGRLIANIGVFSLRHALELAKHAASMNVCAISSVAPFYFPFSKEELIQYYFELAERSGLPVLVYNVPALAGVEFNTRDLYRLLSHDGIAGIKQTSMNLFQTEQLVRHFPEKSIVNGHDEIFLSALSVGVRSCIGSTVTFMPEMYVEIMRRFNTGDMTGAHELQGKVNEIITVLCDVGVFKGVKAALRERGIDCGECRRPFQSLTAEEIARIKEALDKFVSVT